MVEQAFSRAAGAPLVPGNRVVLLRDAAENYPAWLEAIRAAQKRIYFENYIFADDHVGREFAEALAERARAGVRVLVVRDWLGSRSSHRSELWNALEESGVQTRVFNPPRWTDPTAFLTRDHRKLVCVDGRVAFVSGLCVSKSWLGDPQSHIPPWRDAGVEVEGPAVEFIERAFRRVWATTGAALPEPAPEPFDGALPVQPGNVQLRVIATEPSNAGLFRLDQVIAVAARRTLWLTDAYFVNVGPYVQALKSAARDGVDVRLLVPGATDIPALSPISRAGYRPLLEAGVRIFEWNGSMLHAKTSVSDGRWCRIGSSNLNLASFIANYELDLAIEDEAFGARMEATYLDDLQHSTEIVLGRRRRLVKTEAVAHPGAAASGGSRASAAAVGALRVAGAVGSAVRSRRYPESADRKVVRRLALTLLALGLVAAIWPRPVGWVISAIALWFSVVLLIKASRKSSSSDPKD